VAGDWTRGPVVARPGWTLVERRHALTVKATFAMFGVGLALTAPMGCRRSRLPPKPDGAAVVIAAEPTPESGFTMADEVEPNDLLANAQGLTPTLETGVGVVGRLVSAPGARSKDVDLFRILVPAPPVVVAGPDGAVPVMRQRLRIEAHPDPGQTVSVDILDDEGRVQVGAVGATPGEAEGIPNLSVVPGGVFVRVRPGSLAAAAASATPNPDPSRKAPAAPSPGGYRLTVRLLPVEVGDEIEPNGKGPLASDVAADGDVAGYLGWRHDEDWFRIPTAGLPEGGVLSIDLDPVEGVAASLAVYDSVQHKMIEQHGRRGDRVALRNVRLPSSDPNVYVVVAADTGRNLDARYTLHLHTEDAKADVELEPNDDPAHAVPMADGTSTGTLGPGDADVFRYTAPGPTELNVELVPPPHVDAKLEVLRDDGTVVMKVDSGKRGVAERVANLYVAGTTLLRLSPAKKGDGNLDEPYRITLTGRPIEAGAEREPNGSAPTATPLPAGTTGGGLIFPRGDVDFWNVATSGQDASLNIAVRGIAGMKLDLRVHATTSGRELARFQVGGDGSAPTRVTPQPTEGCCLIQVRETTGRGANPKERYAISVAP